MTDVRDLQIGALYHVVSGRNSMVPWYSLDSNRSIARPHVGELMLYLGRGSIMVGDRSPTASPDSWCLLRADGIAEVFNLSFAQHLEAL